MVSSFTKRAEAVILLRLRRGIGDSVSLKSIGTERRVIFRFGGAGLGVSLSGSSGEAGGEGELRSIGDLVDDPALEVDALLLADDRRFRGLTRLETGRMKCVRVS